MEKDKDSVKAKLEKWRKEKATENTENVKIEEPEEIEIKDFGLSPDEFREEVQGGEIEVDPQTSDVVVKENPEIDPDFDPRTSDIAVQSKNLPDPVYVEKQTRKEKEIHIKKVEERGHGR